MIGSSRPLCCVHSPSHPTEMTWESEAPAARQLAGVFEAHSYAWILSEFRSIVRGLSYCSVVVVLDKFGCQFSRGYYARTLCSPTIDFGGIWFVTVAWPSWRETISHLAVYDKDGLDGQMPLPRTYTYTYIYHLIPPSTTGTGGVKRGSTRSRVNVYAQVHSILCVLMVPVAGLLLGPRGFLWEIGGKHIAVALVGFRRIFDGCWSP